MSYLCPSFKRVTVYPDSQGYVWDWKDKGCYEHTMDLILNVKNNKNVSKHFTLNEGINEN